ncbi:MAG: FeoB-associated Cys-rich membrane protein [Clostridia bacterium]|nr:FeoB-associated Cys-rich membrane protein [Clostridia bacterium]
MENLIPVLILVLLLGGAALYIYKAKKRGVTCIGCPHAKTCAHRGHCPSGASAEPKDETNTNES